MSKRWQVIEKSVGSDWSLVRNDREVLDRFDSKESATAAAIKYITSRNCDNALTKSEKLHSVECFMKMNDAIFLGILDGEEWYMTHPKDIRNKNVKTNDRVIVDNKDEDDTIVHVKGERVKESNFFLLEGKDEVSVRPVPGT